jgi:glycosyltransferase involved in cell wall biosynthesis
MKAVTNEPLEVSICLLAFNHVRYIERCIRSALEQAADVRIEILVGDDASNDGTSEILSTYAQAHPELIRHIRRNERLGGSANYLDLLSRARAPLIAHLDGDDFWLPNKLRQQVAYLRAHPNCAAVYTNALAISERGEEIGIFNNFRRVEIDLAKLLRNGNFLCNSSMLHRSALLATIFAIEGPVLDYRVHLLNAANGYLAQLPEALVGYRVNSAGSMVAQANDFVRNLYWEAILSVPCQRIAKADLAMGMADFMRRVLFRATRARRWNLVHEWLPKIYRASPLGIIRTTAYLFVAVATAFSQVMRARFERGPDGQRHRVLYPNRG